MAEKTSYGAAKSSSSTPSNITTWMRSVPGVSAAAAAEVVVAVPHERARGAQGRGGAE